jgi:hypothetical protein
MYKTNNPPPQAGRSTFVHFLPSEAPEQIQTIARKTFENFPPQKNHLSSSCGGILETC